MLFFSGIEGHRETIHRLLRFIGEPMQPYSVARLRRERPALPAEVTLRQRSKLPA